MNELKIFDNEEIQIEELYIDNYPRTASPGDTGAKGPVCRQYYRPILLETVKNCASFGI